MSCGGGGGPVNGLMAYTPFGAATNALYGMGGDGGAGAAQAAAMAAQAQAQKNYSTVNGMVNTSMKQMDASTVAGLNNMDQMIQKQDQNIGRQEQLISQIDPTVIAASQQALKLLQGQSSPVLGPMQAQRDMQRQKLVDTLRSQMGPGAETSTAGMQALSNFDRDTNSLTSNAQQQALQTVSGVGGTFNSMRPNMMGEIMGRAQMGQERYGLGANQAQFGLNSAGVLNNAAQALQQTAGAQYTGDVIKGQNQRAFMNQVTGSLVQGGMAYATGGMSGMGGMRGGGSGGSYG